MDPDTAWIIQRESAGNPKADNPTTTAFGLGQLIEANRQHYGGMLGVDPDTTDPREQHQMMSLYIQDRYGTPAKAREFWEENRWY